MLSDLDSVFARFQFSCGLDIISPKGWILFLKHIFVGYYFSWVGFVYYGAGILFWDFYEQLLSTEILFVIFIVVYTFIHNVSKLALTAVYNCVLILYHNKCYFLILGLLVVILTLL